MKYVLNLSWTQQLRPKTHYQIDRIWYHLKKLKKSHTISCGPKTATNNNKKYKTAGAHNRRRHWRSLSRTLICNAGWIQGWNATYNHSKWTDTRWEKTDNNIIVVTVQAMAAYTRMHSAFSLSVRATVLLQVLYSYDPHSSTHTYGSLHSVVRTRRICEASACMRSMGTTEKR